jgi:MFS transporter, OFA family, oxalate/formate antiporter
VQEVYRNLSGVWRTDKEILGYSRYILLVAAFFAMFVISPYQYAWSSMSARIAGAYGWSHEQIALLFTLFVIFQSLGMLPGGMLVDRFGPRLSIGFSAVLASMGVFALTLGPNFILVSSLWCVGSFFTGFIFNGTISITNKWFYDKRGVMIGLVAGAFAWGSLPFIFSIRAISLHAPVSAFWHIIDIMAALISIVGIISALFMKNPPLGWRLLKNDGSRASKSPMKRQYSVREALMTWRMWILIASFVLISGSGLSGISKMVAYSNSFGFTAVAATAATGGIAVATGFGKLITGVISQRFGCENTMIVTFILSGILLFLTILTGSQGSESMFVVCSIVGIFFLASMFSLFPTIIGHYFGEAAAGGNCGMLFVIGRGLGGIYGGVLSTLLVDHKGFSFAMAIAGAMAIASGLILIPLKSGALHGEQREEGSGTERVE